MIRISHLSKSYADQELFSDVSFVIGKKDRIGLIGRNGSGKSTFLQMLLGNESYDGGTIEIPDGVKVRALEQHMHFSHDTILECVCASLSDGGIAQEWKAKSILMGLGFTESDFSRSPDEFSSGFQVRIRLAQALVSEADLLLLDEPTNYLDILSLRWLSRFLQKWNGAFVLVTHDRSFMETAVSHTVGIHRAKMRKMKGSPEKLIAQIALEETVYEKTRVNQEKKQEKTKEFIRTFRAGARSAGLVQSRIKSLEKQKVHKKLKKLPTIAFHFPSLPFHGTEVLQARNISYAYPDSTPVISGVSLSVLSGDRLAIVGRNGKGKSTLLKLLIQEFTTQTGRVKPYANLEVGYFGAGNTDALMESRTILEEVLASGNVTEQKARTILGALLFPGNAVHKRIADLSGGEKSRVCLAKLMISPVHLLALDEPTNHLDMESCAALIEALKSFPGTVIIVSHDERLLSALATRLVVFDAGQISVCEHSYDDFLQTRGWSEEEEDSFSPKRYKSDSSQKQQYLQKKEHQRQLRQLQKSQTQCEQKLEQLEAEHHEANQAFQLACQESDHEGIRDLGKQSHDLSRAIEAEYELLEEILQKIEGIEQQL